jgi:hypothetical protein
MSRRANFVRITDSKIPRDAWEFNFRPLASLNAHTEYMISLHTTSQEMQYKPALTHCWDIF